MPVGAFSALSISSTLSTRLPKPSPPSSLLPYVCADGNRSESSPCLLITNVMEPRPLIGARSLPLINLRKSLVEGGREERMGERGKKGEKRKAELARLRILHSAAKKQIDVDSQRANRGGGGGGKQKGCGGGGRKRPSYFFSVSSKLCRIFQKFFINCEVAFKGSCR